ncbi:hypothetical protein ACN261_21275 [Micromonospora sp. WMMD723]|uniref:hypothetical protein n=1 Tax=Micromonospora sp. WMMD723 TaxID=3403465 RepID=UPI003CFA29FA
MFPKPLVTSPGIAVGDYTHYDDPDDPTGFEQRNVLYHHGPEQLVIGRFCAIAAGTRFLMAGGDHPVVGGNPARPIRRRFSDDDVHRLRPADLITRHCRTLMTGTPAEIERTAIGYGLERTP